jgi:putative tryptophan/tyrosine transport system substrate-binding protein
MAATAAAVVLEVGVLPTRASSEGAARRVFRVGFLAGGSGGGPSPRVQSFREGLRDLGYSEGQNLEVVARFAGGRAELTRALAVELVALNPDVIVADTALPVTAVKAFTRTIPIVMVAVSDPVETGFIESVARPGSNITGLAINTLEIAAKQVQLLKELAPGVTRIALLWNTSNPVTRRALERAVNASSELGVEIVSFPVAKPEDFDGEIFGPTAVARVDAVIVVADPMSFTFRRKIADAAVTYKLPSMFTFREEASDGGLAAYGTDLATAYRRSAWYVDQILKGSDPATLPVEYPTRYNLVLNAKTAGALRLTIPPTLLARADEVIE